MCEKHGIGLTGTTEVQVQLRIVGVMHSSCGWAFPSPPSKHSKSDSMKRAPGAPVGVEVRRVPEVHLPTNKFQDSD